LVAFAYRSLRVHWAVAGAPSFPPLGADLIGFTGVRGCGQWTGWVGATNATVGR